MTIIERFFTLGLVFGIGISVLNSVSVVENPKINQFILSETLFKSIKGNEMDLLVDFAKATQDLDSLKCLLDLREIAKQFPSLQKAPFLDSWGRLPSGILSGNLADFGNFDECLATSVTLSKLTGLVKGKYCLAHIPVLKQLRARIEDQDIQRSDLLDLLGLIIGICVPHSCSSKFLTSAIDLASRNVSDSLMKGVSVSFCSTSGKPDLEPGDIFAIIFYSFFAGLMVSSTVYEFGMAYFEKKPKPILLTFSVLTNGRKLFAINTARSPNEISCLTGIRVISMVWIVYGHTVLSFLPIAKLNTIESFQWLKTPFSMFTQNATVSVDTFLFMSGLLVAWHGLQSLDRSKGRLNIFVMYIHRYIRLTVPLAALILYASTLYKYAGTGPMYPIATEVFKCDYKSSWPILLYIGNYYDGMGRCLPHTWYLSMDFQMYLLAPFLLIPMWKWGRKFAPILVLMSLLSIGFVMGTYITKGYTNILGIGRIELSKETYTPTHARCSPWLVGFGLGYFLHINRHRTIRFPRILQLIGWVVSLLSMVAIVFGAHFSIISDNGPTVLEAAMSESLKRVSWAIALSWIIFACQFGLGGIVDTFLSHSLWQPFARLSYSLYLLHALVVVILASTNRNGVYFSNSSVTLQFWSNFGVSLVACIPFTLAFESPVLAIEKLTLTKRAKEVTQTQNDHSGSPPDDKVLDFTNKCEK